MIIPELILGYTRRNTLVDNSIAKSLLEEPKSTKKLKDANSEDIKLYDWIANNWYPNYLSQYGNQLAEDMDIFQKTNHGYRKTNIIMGRGLRASQKGIKKIFQKINGCGPQPYSMRDE
jgi:hypothetical protein